ncbi:hypothetical protein FACS1894199_05930 [Bacteroidia bacterium]|nr:hypothetical protein FACS1894199_05930 [Bacteroidia bacterium]
MKKFLISSCIFFVLGNVDAQYSRIDKLAYTGYYNWGFIWVKAGAVDFSLHDSKKYDNATRVEAIGYSISSWDWVFKLRDTLVCHFDKSTLLPYESYRRTHEGNFHKNFDYVWDYPDQRIWASYHRRGKEKILDTIPCKPQTHDMLSAMWYVRYLDYDNYKTGDIIPMKILIDDKVEDLHIRYLGLKRLKLEKSERDCYVFSPLLVAGEVFKGGETMKIWVSKDEERLPLMVEAEILIGSVKGIIDLSKSRYEKKR